MEVNNESLQQEEGNKEIIGTEMTGFLGRIIHGSPKRIETDMVVSMDDSPWTAEEVQVQNGAGRLTLEVVEDITGRSYILNLVQH